MSQKLSIEKQVKVIADVAEPFQLRDRFGTVAMTVGEFVSELLQKCLSDDMLYMTGDLKVVMLHRPDEPPGAPDPRLSDPVLRLAKENEFLRSLLKPVLSVRFKKTNGRAATFFKEAVEKGEPSIRVFVNDWENAVAAIEAVDRVQKEYNKE